MNYPIILALNLTKNHKIGVFVLVWPSRPSFSGFSSTKSRFLCAFAGGWSPTCGIRLRKEGRHTGHGARIEGTGPELRARCQRCGGVGRNKKAPAVPEPSMYVCCVRVIVVEYVSTRTCDVYTFLYTFPYARTFVLLHYCTCTPVRLYVYAGGDGGTRTLVQQNHPKVFYMLSSYLIVGR